MKENHYIQTIDEQGRIYLTARAVVFYFLLVGAVIGTIITSKTPLTNDIVWIIKILYYVLPLILALIFAYLFRPFWKSFRNILFTILVVQFLYSFCVNMMRWDYLQKQSDKNHWKKSDRIKVIKHNAKYFDRNSDGFLDELVLDLTMDFTKIRTGDYLLHGVVVPGASLSPFSIDGGGEFKITERGAKNILARSFVITPRSDLGRIPYEMKNFQVKLMLFRVLSVDEYGHKLLQFARWAPFLRKTNWQGEDKAIYGDWVLLHDVTSPDVFTLRTPAVYPE
ncbi:MAG: hypothetical protein H6754_02170 [Candidatus Omnitrophica bacterium]|nr:hypothetical protein [Candidatus Omnitrophota bacterium]